MPADLATAAVAVRATASLAAKVADWFGRGGPPPNLIAAWIVGWRDMHKYMQDDRFGRGLQAGYLTSMRYYDYVTWPRYREALKWLIIKTGLSDNHNVVEHSEDEHPVAQRLYNHKHIWGRRSVQDFDGYFRVLPESLHKMGVTLSPMMGNFVPGGQVLDSPIARVNSNYRHHYGDNLEREPTPHREVREFGVGCAWAASVLIKEAAGDPPSYLPVNALPQGVRSSFLGLHARTQQEHEHILTISHMYGAEWSKQAAPIWINMRRTGKFSLAYEERLPEDKGWAPALQRIIAEWSVHIDSARAVVTHHLMTGRHPSEYWRGPPPARWAWARAWHDEQRGNLIPMLYYMTTHYRLANRIWPEWRRSKHAHLVRMQFGV